MGQTALYTHSVFMEHNTGSNHPECSGRISSINKSLNDNHFDNLARYEAPLADVSVIKNIHNVDLVDLIFEKMPSSGFSKIDADTIISPASGEAALRAVGAICAAVDIVMSGQADNAFCAVRPPGHHAEPNKSMGFCLFNNVAIATDYARRRYNLTKVAVIDFDVHHGNGTQLAFQNDGDLMFGSSHQYPFYPGTGSISEKGVGNIWNAPLKALSGSIEFRAAMQERIFPALKMHKPELIIISAGFDAHRDDPLAALQLLDDDYFWVTEEITKIASETCNGRIVSSLEGGYNLDVLGLSVAAHVNALMNSQQL